MLLSPLVPRTLGGVTEFLPDDPSTEGETVSGTIISPAWFYHFPTQIFFTTPGETQQKRAVQAKIISRLDTWLFEFPDNLSHLITTPQPNLWVQWVGINAQETFAPCSLFFQLCPWWLLVALGRLGLGLVAALLWSGLAVGGKSQTSGLATTGGQVSYIAAHYCVTPSHIAFCPKPPPLPPFLVLHYLG